MRRLTRRRQVKKRSKHSRKYNKTRGGKYIKKRRSITRRRVLRGGGDDVKYIIDAINISSPGRFRLLVDGLENKPEILHQHRLQDAYKRMIELRKDGAPTGYIGLTGLKFLNYLWARVNLLDTTSKNYKNLQTAISLMDQHALAPGIINSQLPTIQKLSSNSYYYACYEKLFNQLSISMSLPSRNIDSCDSDGGCCSPTGLPTT